MPNAVEAQHAEDLSIERARVIAIPSKATSEGDGRENVLWVETMVSESCDGCSASATCGHSILGRWFSRRQQCIPVRCRSGEASLLTVGQWVEVGVPAAMIVRASLVAYAIPLAGLVLGAMLFSQFGTLLSSSASDGWSITGALVGLVAGLMSTRSVGDRFFGEQHLPRFIRAVAQSDR